MEHLVYVCEITKFCSIISFFVSKKAPYRIFICLQVRICFVLEIPLGASENILSLYAVSTVKTLKKKIIKKSEFKHLNVTFLNTEDIFKVISILQSTTVWGGFLRPHHDYF